MKKYGIKYSFCSQNNKQKSEQTCMKKYGTKNFMASKEGKDKAKQRCLEIYGVDNVFKSKEIQDKIKETLWNKYGVTVPLKNKKLRTKLSKTSRYNKIVKSWNENILTDIYSHPNFSLDFYITNYSPDFEFEFICNKCGNTFTSKHRCGVHKRCEKCYPPTTSIGET